MILFLTVITLLTIFTIIYSFCEYRWFRYTYLKPIDFQCQKPIPSSLNGKRLVFISDLQFDHRSRRFLKGAARKLQHQVNALKPDLVILGGDIIHTQTPTNKEIFPYIKGIQAEKIAILGNHDYRDLSTVYEGLKNSGCRLLVNAAYDYYGLTIVGVDDYIKGKPTYPKQPSTYSLLLTHNPDYFKATTRPIQSDMALAGHLHGGQITLFGKYAPISNSQFGQELLHGMKETHQGSIYVSSGVGGTVGVLPIRFFARPEIVILDFQT